MRGKRQSLSGEGTPFDDSRSPLTPALSREGRGSEDAPARSRPGALPRRFAAGTSLRGRAPYQFSQDAVQEFQVLSNGFSAEFGRAIGGVINTVTRSGTNNVHGTGFWFFRNRTLNCWCRKGITLGLMPICNGISRWTMWTVHYPYCRRWPNRKLTV